MTYLDSLKSVTVVTVSTFLWVTEVNKKLISKQLYLR